MIGGCDELDDIGYGLRVIDDYGVLVRAGCDKFWCCGILGIQREYGW